MSDFVMDAAGVVVSCPQCGQRNRFRYKVIDKPARCGGCQADLPPINQPLVVPDHEEFGALITHSALPVLVDFWAAWCGPCKMLGPELVKTAQQCAGKFLIAKVDTEALPGLSQQYGIQSLPTMVMFYGGKEVDRTSGARPATHIAQFALQAIEAERA
jgi:thioredoxin 2